MFEELLRMFQGLLGENLAFCFTVFVLAILIGSIGWIVTSSQRRKAEADDTPPATPKPVIFGENNEDEDGDEEGSDFEPTVGETYSLTESPYPAEILVQQVLDEEEVYGNLVIELPAGADFVSIQRVVSDDDAVGYVLFGRFVIVYFLNGEYVTQTWDEDLFLNDYEVYPEEIIIRETLIQ